MGSLLDIPLRYPLLLDMDDNIRYLIGYPTLIRYPLDIKLGLVN
jgi:hypothetical protein